MLSGEESLSGVGGLFFTVLCLLGVGDGTTPDSGDFALIGCLPLANLKKLGDSADMLPSFLGMARFGGRCPVGFLVEASPDPVDLEGELCEPRETFARRGGATFRTDDRGELLGEDFGEPL